MNSKLTIDNVEKIVYENKTKHQMGYTRFELQELLKSHDIDMDKFYEKMGPNTVGVIETEVIIYHHDILKGLRCVLEDREQTTEEWD